MLPDYPKLKKRLNAKMTRLVQQEMDKDQFIASIPKQRVYEGNSLTTNSVDAYSTTTDFPQIISDFEVTREQIVKEGPDAIFSKKGQVAKRMSEQITDQMVKAMDHATQMTGNIVNVKQVSETSNPILEMIEKIEIDFNKQGQPIIPSIVVSPDQSEKTKEYLKDLQRPEMQEKYQKVMARKWREWLDRENSRKLVD